MYQFIVKNAGCFPSGCGHKRYHLCYNDETMFRDVPTDVIYGLNIRFNL